MFEISQLRCFVAVAEELHFSRAAERLHMTQPPLSRQIRLLEHHVGAQLLARNSRTVKLTAAGKAFFPEAARILRIAEEATFTARRAARGEQGSLAIGFTSASGYSLLPEVVRRLRERAPGIALTLKELVSTAQVEALNAGELDKGVEILGEILKNKPSDMNILNMIAEGYYYKGRFVQAMDYWDKMLEYDKANASALYMIGMCYQKKGEKDKGIHLCDKAIEMDPSLASLKQKKMDMGL